MDKNEQHIGVLKAFAGIFKRNSIGGRGNGGNPGADPVNAMHLSSWLNRVELPLDEELFLRMNKNVPLPEKGRH